MGSVSLKRITYSYIMLITPKRKSPSAVGDYRLTALINSTCKIMSKILTNKLYSLLQNLIGDYQSGFIVGRNNSKGVAIA